MGTVVRVSVSSNVEDTGYVVPKWNPFDGTGGEEKFLKKSRGSCTAVDRDRESHSDGYVSNKVD